MNFFQFVCHLLNWMEHSTLEEASFCRCNNRRNQLSRVDWTSWNFILSCYWWINTSGCSGQARQCSALAFGDLANTYVSTVLKAGYRYERIDIVFDRYQEETIKATNKKQRSIKFYWGNYYFWRLHQKSTTHSYTEILSLLRCWQAHNNWCGLNIWFPTFATTIDTLLKTCAM